MRLRATSKGSRGRGTALAVPETSVVGIARKRLLRKSRKNSSVCSTFFHIRSELKNLKQNKKQSLMNNTMEFEALVTRIGDLTDGLALHQNLEGDASRESRIYYGIRTN